MSLGEGRGRRHRANTPDRRNRTAAAEPVAPHLLRRDAGVWHQTLQAHVQYLKVAQGLNLPSQRHPFPSGM